jgi:hypothetical protein
MQVNRRDIIALVKFTVTTTFLYTIIKVFSKIMTEGQEVMERTNSPTLCRSTNKDSFSIDMCGCIFHSFSV